MLVLGGRFSDFDKKRVELVLEHPRKILEDDMGPTAQQ